MFGEIVWLGYSLFSFFILCHNLKFGALKKKLTEYLFKGKHFLKIIYMILTLGPSSPKGPTGPSSPLKKNQNISWPEIAFKNINPVLFILKSEVYSEI